VTPPARDVCPATEARFAIQDQSSNLDVLAASVEAAIASGSFPVFDPQAGETVLAPDAAGRGCWVGAPSVVYDSQSRRVLMSYRRRRPRDGSVNERGYVGIVAQSTDGGRSFTEVWHVTKRQIGTSSLERFCLRRGPAGDWLLYTSWEDPPSSDRWRIDLLRAPEPEHFDISTAQSVIVPADFGIDAVKDPYVISHDTQMLMYMSTFLRQHGPAPTSLASSRNSLRYTWRGEALAVGSSGSWDAHQARLGCVVPFGGGFVGYYDGAGSEAMDTEERCGIACSVDLTSWRRISVHAPALVSPHATGSLRYVDVVSIAGSWWAYYEYSRADGSHELRRNEVKADNVSPPAIGSSAYRSRRCSLV
jgi:hypothetical protein